MSGKYAWLAIDRHMLDDYGAYIYRVVEQYLCKDVVRESGSVYRAWIDNAHGRTTDQDRREVP
mgnify:CR=1 FL=1